MKKITKFIVSIFCLFILINIIYLLTYKSKADFISDASSFGKPGGTSTPSISTVTGDLVTIGEVLTSIGVGVLVLATTYLGIMYFISGPEAQGKLKGQLFGLVAAAVVIFGSYGIWKMAVEIAEQISFS